MAKDMLQDPDWNVRWTATHYLGKLADAKMAGEIRPLLLKILAEDKDARVRRNALWAMYLFPDKPPEDFWKNIRAAMDDESPGVRETAATMAAKFWHPELAPGLAKLSNDPEPQVRTEAALVLARHKGTREFLSADHSPSSCSAPDGGPSPGQRSGPDAP